MTKSVLLKSETTEVEVALYGAEPMAWRVGGTELLWQADASIWGRTSPILFPVVGRTRGGEITVHGRPYPMAPHGFIASHEFSIVAQSESSVTLAATDNGETHKSYPFPFHIEVRYDVGPGRCSVTFVVRNPGPDSLPYALGFHPGFRWPFAGGDKSSYALVFDQEEEPMASVLNKEGLLASTKLAVPMDGYRLPLSDALVSQGALCFLNLISRRVRFIAQNGSTIELRSENFPHLALWGKTDAPFACIEPWTGYSDPEGFAGDIKEKPSICLVESGCEARHKLDMTFWATK